MQENLEEIGTEDWRAKVCLGLSHLTSNYGEHPLPKGSKATSHPRGLSRSLAPCPLLSSLVSGLQLLGWHKGEVRLVRGSSCEGIQLWDPISIPNSGIRCWEWATLPGSHCFVALESLKVEVHKDSSGVHGQRVAVPQECTPPQEDMGHSLASFNYEQRGALWLLPHKREREEIRLENQSQK